MSGFYRPSQRDSLRLRRFASAYSAGIVLQGFNPADTATEITLGSANSIATRSTTNDGSWRSTRSVTSHSSGKWYAECVDVSDGSTNGAMMFGVGASTASLSNYPGSGADSWGTQANNTIQRTVYHSGTGTGYSGVGISTGGYATIAVDFAAGKIWFGDSSAGWFGSGNPDTGTNATYTFTPGTTLFLMLGEQRSPQQCTLKNNPGDNAGAIPGGYSMWG